MMNPWMYHCQVHHQQRSRQRQWTKTECRCVRNHQVAVQNRVDCQLCGCLNTIIIRCILPTTPPPPLPPSPSPMQEALQSSGAMVDYSYDVDEELWCQFTLRVSFVVYEHNMHGCVGFHSIMLL